MPASLVPNGMQQFIDINGAPLVGGLVYFYLPMTLTPKNTWQDAGETVVNTNPVVLDSRGQAVIYGSGSYRQILTDSLGNTIWDTEISGFQESVFGPQTTINAATITDLGTVTSNNVLINGAATINSFGLSASLANPVYLLRFAGINTLTNNATSMILLGGVNITTAANDCALVEFINALGYWRMLAYFPAAGTAALGTAALRNIGTSGSNVPLLNGGNTWSGIQLFTVKTYGGIQVLTVSAGAVTPDMATANFFDVVTSVNLTINDPININGGQSGVIAVTQTNAGLSLAWGGVFKAPGGIAAVTLSGINGATDYFAYYAHDGANFIVTPILNPT